MHLPDGRFRRVLPVAADPGEGRFIEPTAATQAWRRELVFMPPNRTLRPLARDVSTGGKNNNRDKFPAGWEDRLSAVGDAKLRAK